MPVERRDVSGAFFLLQGVLQGFEAFENVLGDDGTLRDKFHAAGNHALGGVDLGFCHFLSVVGFLGEIENVRKREHVEGFVEGALEALALETLLQVGKGFVDGAFARLDAARVELALFAVADKGDFGLGVGNEVYVLEIVRVAEKLDARVARGEERVRNAVFEHSVKNAFEGIRGAPVRSELLDGCIGKPVRELVEKLRRLLDLDMDGRVLGGCRGNFRLERPVSFDIRKVGLQVVFDADRFVVVELENRIDLVCRAGLFRQDFLGGLGNLEGNRSDNRSRTDLS